MKGWTGRILSIDLSQESSVTLNPQPDCYASCIGGRGMAGYFLRPRAAASWDSPDMPLLFFTGPLVGTPAPTSGRMTIMSRSPLTGTACDTSVGGRFGTELKRAGFDGIVITGTAARPVGIVIKDSHVEIVDASSLRGARVSEVIRRAGDKAAIAAIGSAADAGCLFASIAVDGHFFSGRGGLGLVMAGKNLRFITVRGSGRVDIHDHEELARAREEILRLVAASPILSGEFGFSEFGTGALYDLTGARRLMPTDNFTKTVFERAADMNAWHYKKKYESKKRGCYGCSILCKKVGREGETMPEFETMSHFSALLGNDTIETVIAANRICNETGMDTISAAVTLACYAEIEGVTLTPADILRLLEDIAASRGEGEILKLGARRYADYRGRPQAAMTVKDLELPAYDPRGAYGMALAYAVATRGGCHLRSYPIAHEILRKPVATDRFEFAGKARIVAITEDIHAAADCLTACRFVFFAATLEEYAHAFQAVTGTETTAQDLIRVGERTVYRERVMNAMNGFTAKDDDLPDRFFTQPGSSGGGIDIPPINRAAFLEARRAYYLIRGLDENGMPTESKTRELGIDRERA